MNSARIVSVAIVASMALSLQSCSGEKPFRKQTTKVTGKVTIDGAVPDPPAQVECIASGGMDKSHPTFSRCDTKPDGSFEIATYEQGDGVPAGDYALVFTWRPFNLMSRDYGPDKFKGKYAKAETSKIKFTIADGDKPADLGTIDLSTAK